MLKEGRIAEHGTHDELLKCEGLYAGMWRDYQTSIQWKIGKEAQL